MDMESAAAKGRDPACAANKIIYLAARVVLVVADK